MAAREFFEPREEVPAAGEAVPVKPARNVYKVVGPRDVFGVKPGETGEFADLTFDQVRALVEAGHIASATTEEA